MCGRGVGWGVARVVLVAGAGDDEHDVDVGASQGRGGGLNHQLLRLTA